MARWMWPAVAGIVTSATGVAINLATDARANPWAWVVVVVLTSLGVVVALRAQGTPATPPAEAAPEATLRATPPPEAAPEPEVPPSVVHNELSAGVVQGTVVQVGYIGRANSPTTVNQRAIAHEGGTIHQAGRDVNGNP